MLPITRADFLANGCDSEGFSHLPEVLTACSLDSGDKTFKILSVTSKGAARGTIIISSNSSACQAVEAHLNIVLGSLLPLISAFK